MWRNEGAAEASLQLLDVECNGCTYIRSAMGICKLNSRRDVEQMALELVLGATFQRLS